MRSSFSRRGQLCLLLVAGACVPLRADPVLETYGPTLTSYVATTASTVQGIRPVAANRGVFLDGTLRLGSLQGWSLAGNPFGERWDANLWLGPVRLDTGSYAPTEVDLSLPASVPWLVGRSFNAQQDSSGHTTSNGYQGKNWMQMSQPELVFKAGATADLDVIYIVYGADRYIELKRTGVSSNEFKAKNGAAGVMQYVSGSPDTYVYYDQAGRKTTFFGNNTASNQANWQVWKIEDPAGNVAYVGSTVSATSALSNGYDSGGKITTAYDSAGRRYSYTYTTLDSVPRLTQVKAEVNSGGWTEVARVEYSYYQSGGETYGVAGNLRTVKLTIPQTDTNLVKTKLYRYWTGTFNASTNPGHTDTIKHVVDYEGYRAADWTDSTFDDDPIANLDNDQIKPYSSAYFEYDSSYRIVEGYFDGECGCSNGNNGTYILTYGTNSGYSDASEYDTDTVSGQVGAKGKWARRTVVARPDGAYQTQYFDEAGQPLSRVTTDADPATATNTWPTMVLRDTAGVISLISPPANSDGYTHSTGAFATKDVSEIVRPVAAVSSGALAGFAKHLEYRAGAKETGTNPSPSTTYVQSTTEYTSASLTVGGSSVVRPLAQYTWVYTQDTAEANAGVHGSPAPSGAYETQRAYTMWTGAAALMPKQVTITHPAVSTANNGSGSSTLDYRYLRKDGTTAFARTDEDIFTYTQYTNGQLVKQIQDAQTNHASDFASGDDPGTDFGVTESGSGLRRITTYSYDAQGRPDTTTLPDGRVTKMYYTVLADRRLVTVSIPKYVSGTGTFHGPASYTVSNHAGKVEVQGTIALSTTTTALSSWINETQSDPISALLVGTLASMKTSIYNNTGTRVTQARAYFSIPGSGAGTEGTNYDAVRYGYDDMGRVRRVKSAAGTVTRTRYDSIGRRSTTWIGTNDNDTDLFNDTDKDSSGVSDMVKVEALEYDGGSARKNSNLTKRTVDADGDWGVTTDQRVTEYKYDDRDRLVATINPQSPHVVTAYDGLNRVTGTATYSSSSGLSGTSVPTATTNRIGYSQTFYDEKGQVYKTTRHKVTLATGASADSIDTLRWYDDEGRLVKVKGDGQHAKHKYNRVGWQTHGFVLATDNDTVYADADDVSGDVTLQESQSVYDSSSGLVLFRVTLGRHYDELSNEDTAELDSNADGDAATLTAANCEGRVMITALYYDSLDRLTDTAVYGTNGIVGDGSNTTGTFTRSGTVPTRSDTILVTTNAYNTDGTLQSVTDPKGLVTRYEYDALFRQTKVIRNYDDGTPGGGTHSDKDQTVKYEYSKGLRTKIIADLPAGQTDQETLYIYGTTKGTPTQMKLGTKHLLRAVKYPDSGNAGTTTANIDTDSSDVVSYAYNALSEQVYAKDQAGTVIESEYDSGGRQTQRKITNLAAGLDNAVLRIATTYTSRGQVEKVTQYSSASGGTVTDDIKYSYDDWGNVTSFKQDPDSEIDQTAADRAAYEVTYTYAKASPTNGSTRVRRTSMVSPGMTYINYNYLSTGNKLDDAASRVSEVVADVTIDFNPVTVATYEYTGVAQVVGTALPEPNFYSRQYGSGTGVYDSLDRFNRPIESTWTKGNATPRKFYDVDITYDRNSNITRIEDNIHTSAAGGTGNGKFDVLYTNDDLGRLIRAEEGNWSGTLIDNDTREQRWMDGSNNSSLDQVGNWGRFRMDLNGDGDFTDTSELDDTRTHNVVNELTARDTDTNSSNNYTLSYDAAGNLTDDGQACKYVYDGFGRVVTVKNQSNAVVAEYRYNGLNYRISWHYDVTGSGGTPDGTVNSTDPVYFFCHDDHWRIVATFRYPGSGTSSEAPKEAFVWHNAGLGGTGSSSYIDAVVLRDRDADTSWASAADGTLEERLYLMQNWRADVSLVVSAGAILKEFVKYSPYGEPFCMTAGCTSSSGNTTVADFTQLLNWIGAGSWDARADTDTDGDLDSSDDDNFIIGNYGRGYLSSSDVANRIGYAGYQHARELAGSKWHVRYRMLDAELGRWTERDPLGMSEGTNPYEYAHSAPKSYTDPDGRAAAACGPGHCHGSTCFYTYTTAQCPPTINSISVSPPNSPQCPNPPTQQTMNQINFQAALQCMSGCFNGPFDDCQAAFAPCTCQNLWFSRMYQSTGSGTIIVTIGSCIYTLSVSFSTWVSEWEGECYPPGGPPPPPPPPGGPGVACAQQEVQQVTMVRR